ncbi:MAG TPA: serine hydroxymethyltransferase, partial [Candidatus Jacksonbacteria bacterium]|nr:serine hydroxymethyltransferase [Candidatus Jacksonbacteria bacterium]
FDPRTPFDPSGIRLGTPGLTSRGMKEGEMKTIGELIANILKNTGNITVTQKTANKVIELTKQFPIYEELM